VPLVDAPSVRSTGLSCLPRLPRRHKCGRWTPRIQKLMICSATDLPPKPPSAPHLTPPVRASFLSSFNSSTLPAALPCPRNPSSLLLCRSLTLDTTVAASSFFTFFLPASRLPLVVLVIGSARLSRRVSPLSPYSIPFVLLARQLSSIYCIYHTAPYNNHRKRILNRRASSPLIDIPIVLLIKHLFGIFPRPSQLFYQSLIERSQCFT
jgi:hypothetical protein